ncbi:MAG: hypothetical protein JHC93_05310 [Parachlamydiales bacterium]|nr:hypothetical protein [Parachlamydiales bacterium]
MAEVTNIKKFEYSAQDIAEINKVDTKKHIYLKVLGRGEKIHFKAEHKSFFGRVFMWLGISRCSFNHVIHHILSHQTSNAVVNDAIHSKLCDKAIHYKASHLVFSKVYNFKDHIHKINSPTTTPIVPTKVPVKVSISPKKEMQERRAAYNESNFFKENGISNQLTQMDSFKDLPVVVQVQSPQVEQENKLDQNPVSINENLSKPTLLGYAYEKEREHKEFLAKNSDSTLLHLIEEISKPSVKEGVDKQSSPHQVSRRNSFPADSSKNNFKQVWRPVFIVQADIGTTQPLLNTNSALSDVAPDMGTSNVHVDNLPKVVKPLPPVPKIPSLQPKNLDSTNNS